MRDWDYYSIRKIKNSIIKRSKNLSLEKYANRRVMSLEESSRLLIDAIKEGNPFVASRFGSTECSVICRREAKKNHRYLPNYDHNLCNLSGFFPYDEKLIDRFADLITGMISEIDLLGIWSPSMEEYLVWKYMPNTKLTNLGGLGPQFDADADKTWNSYLSGKRVLVIHPFQKSIEYQYAKRNLLFERDYILPDFELITLRAVQTIAGNSDERFANWFEALEYMKDQIRNIDFDIALIGCGAYGMPLAVEVKRLGKIAIHCGGDLQLLFGIKGSRWDNTVGKTIYNDSWIRPLDEDRVAGYKSVENGCYW